MIIYRDSTVTGTTIYYCCQSATIIFHAALQIEKHPGIEMSMLTPGIKPSRSSEINKCISNSATNMISIYIQFIKATSHRRSGKTLTNQSLQIDGM